MALFENRSEDEILATLLAQLVAQTELVDLAEGSVMLHILRTFARESASIEFRMRVLRDAISMISANGTDLDERVAELPPPELVRRTSSPANGATVEIRLSDASEVTIPKGTVYGRSSNPDLKYVQTVDVVVPAGTLGADGLRTFPENPPPLGTDNFIPVICTASGSIGTAKANDIDQLISGPSFIVTVTSKNLIEGIDSETDESLRNRAILYLSSLARSQPAALEFLAMSFVSSDGVQVKSATAYESPERPGFTELVVDFGGKQPVVKGQAYVDTVPTGDANLISTIIYHDSPATNPITGVEFSIKPVGSANFSPADPDKYVSIYERGIIYPLAGLLSPGDQWKVDSYSYYAGAIQELQALIEGNTSDPLSLSGAGHRAAGTRVVVCPIQEQILLGPGAITASIVVMDGVDIASLRLAAQVEVHAYINSLSPGEPLFVSKIIQKIMNLRGVINADVSKPTDDLYPNDFKHAIRVAIENVEIS